jgi:hypothetical protein
MTSSLLSNNNFPLSGLCITLILHNESQTPIFLHDGKTKLMVYDQDLLVLLVQMTGAS